ncbi:MAG: hypothetical protein HC882_00285 [Acidobacteria bacterium]|nr:hypothetical protein [Acidobacteriota bacterium]
MQRMRLGFARSVGLGQPPDTAPDADTRRGYVAVPTFDVERYVTEKFRTFGMGAVVGFGIGAAVAALFKRQP